MSQQKLHLGDGLSLPIDFITQTQAILARKRVGKSYLAGVQAEELLRLRQQVLVIDYTGAWYGLRAGHDGKPEGGYPIHVFGGDHADVPLEERAGEILAAAAVKERFSAILDLSHFRKAEALRFLAPFLETLYRLNREALHLIADECDAYAPQRTFAIEDGRTLGAMNDIVRRGGIRGIGCTLISQRPAVINKDILTMCGILTCLRISHPKDLAPVKEWVELHDIGSQTEAMIESLPSLPIGTAWMWAPGWPDEAGIFQRFKVRHKETFDSGATPKAGQAVRTPKSLRVVDLAKLGEQMRTAVEESKANDRTALKAKIAKLEKDLATKPAAAQIKVERVEVPVLTEAEKKLLYDVRDRLSHFRETAEMVAQACTLISKATAPAAAPKPPATHKPANNSGNKTHTKLQPQRPERVADAALAKAPRLILTALVQHGPSPKSKVAILTGYAASGGGFNNALGSLRSAGYLNGHGDLLQATDAGAEALGAVQPLPSGQALIDQWKRDLPKAEAAVLEILCGRYPEELTKEEVAAAAGYEPSGGGFNNALGRLRTLELISGRGALKASDSLFA